MSIGDMYMFVLQCKVRLRSCFLQAGEVKEGGSLSIKAEGLGEDGEPGFMPPASSAPH